MEEAGVTSTRTGSRKTEPDRATISRGMVAEKRSVWRRTGSNGNKRLISAIKPMSSIRVRLVQHEMRQVPEFDLSLSDQVEQTSGSGDQNIDAPAEPVRLRSLLDSPENRRVLQARILSVIGERLADLKGEFPRGGQNEGPNSTAAAFPVRPSPPLAPERNGLFRDGPTVPVRGTVPRSVSARGAGRTPAVLPRAGLGDSENIRAPQDDRNSPLLDGRELVVSFFADSLQDRLRHVQFVECHNDFRVRIRGTF